MAHSLKMKKIVFIVAAIILVGMINVCAVAQSTGVPLKPPTRFGAISYPTWSPKGDLAAFVYTIGGDSEVYLVNADGTKLRNVSRNKAIDTNPVWSPDGKTLLFTSRRSGKADIYYIDPYQGRKPKAKKLIKDRQKGDNLWPAWSPDSKTVAFCSYEKGYPLVYFLDVAAGTSEQFFDKRACYPAFSADGKRLALSSEGDIFVFKLKNKKSKNITENLIEGNAVDDTLPVWAPRGTRIAFIGRYEAYSSEIYTISANGKKVRRITDDLFEDFIPRWGPKGKGVIYSAFVGGRPPEIFVSDPESPEKTRLTDNHIVEMSPVFSPDGRTILFVKRTNIQDDLYIMDSNGENVRKFLHEKLPTVRNYYDRQKQKKKEQYRQ